MKSEETSNSKEDKEVKTEQVKNSPAEKPTNKKCKRNLDTSKNALDNENDNDQDNDEKGKTTRAKKTKKEKKGNGDYSFYF